MEAQPDPLRALLASAPFGVALVDTEMRYIEVNEYLAGVHGRPAAEHPGLTVREVVPGVADELEHHAREVLRTGKRTQQVALRGQGSPGEEPIWLVTMHPVHGPDGLITGVGAVVLDITPQVRSAEERDHAERRLRQSAQRLELALRAGRMGTWEWYIESGEVRWSETLEAIYGLRPGEFKGTYEDYAARLHPDERDAVLARSRAAAEAQAVMPDLEHRIVWPDGTVRWTLGSGGPLFDDDGRMIGMMGLVQDITDRKVAELERAALLEAERTARAEAEAARERLGFLAQITAVLGTTFDVDELLEKVTNLAVGEFADGCSVDLLLDGSLRRAVLHHRDPHQAQLYRALRRHYPPRPGSGNPLLRTIETQEPWLLPIVPMDLLDDYAEDERHRAILAELRVGSVMVVPLTGRNQVLGLLSFVCERREAYNAETLAVARDIGRRLGMAIENAHLYQERSRGERRFRRLADTLQASLLPPHLPSIPGVELAAAYRPAAKGLDIGGDFYDVFPLRDDQWGIVIGDVCGKGPEAASLTAFARYTLRAAAVQQECPRATVALLNSATVRDADGAGTRFLTLAYVRAALTPGGVAARLVLAGHPRPLVLRAAGAVEAVGEPGTLLGVVEDPELHETELLLYPGDAMLLFTDGVPETRTAEDMFGEERLAQVVAACAGLEPQKLLDRVLDALGDFGGGVGRDDLALLCLRVQA